MKNSVVHDPELWPLQLELMPELLKRVITAKDDPERPVPEERVVRHLVNRQADGRCFDVLDRMCGVARYAGELFPVIPGVNVFGEEIGEEDLLLANLEWLGTDAARLSVSYTRKAQRRMIDSRRIEIEEARERRAVDLPPLIDVLESFSARAALSWSPVLDRGSVGGPQSSRYFGSPWMPDGEAWPVDADGKPMSFMLQVNLAEMPPQMRARFGRQGILSVFRDDPDIFAEGDTALGEGIEIRRYDAALEGTVRDAGLAAPLAVRVVGWRPADDYPRICDFVEATDVPARIRDAAAWMDERDGAPGGHTVRWRGQPPHADDIEGFSDTARHLWGDGHATAMQAAEAVDMYCAAGDKLGGWPNWTDGPQWPDLDGRRMALFMQLDLADPVYEGAGRRDGARGQIFFDPDAPEAVAFVWNTQGHESR